MMSQTIPQTLLLRLLLAFLMPMLLLSCDGSEIPSGSTSELGCEAYRGQVLKGVFRHPGDAPSAGEWAILHQPRLITPGVIVSRSERFLNVMMVNLRL